MAERFDFDPGPDPRAVAYLEAKGLVRSWRWPSIWREQHAFGFTLAGVHRLDVIAAAKQLTTQAVARGETYEMFQEQFEERLKKLGFAGRQVVTEFAEGERTVNLSAPWRTKVIYDTNIRGAYAAAEWQAIEDTAADFPALEYQGVSDEKTRASHRQWFGVVLPVGHVFWRTWYPPNDWFCRCYVIQVSLSEISSGSAKVVSDEQLEAMGVELNPARWPTWSHGPTGRVARAPEDVGPGFAYNAGMARRANLGELLARKVEDLDSDLARAAAADLVNLPVFQDLVGDALRIGVARAEARAAVADQARRLARPAGEQLAAQAADQAGTFPPDSWPVGVLPPLAGDAQSLVVANASAIGHSAHIHPVPAADWRRVQLLLEYGEVWRAEAGDLVVIGTFRSGGEEQTWNLALKPVAGAYRVRTLHPTSPRRRARLVRDREQLRRGGDVIELEG